MSRFSLRGLLCVIGFLCVLLASWQLSPLVRAGAAIGAALAGLTVWAVWQGLVPDNEA
ncbi:MAG: hypothetical protein U0836_03630 [Pirellulales bacterium]